MSQLGRAHESADAPETITRRTAIRRAVGGGLALGSAGTLAGCGIQQTVATVKGERPRRGGTLRAGMNSGGGLETQDPSILLNDVDILRGNLLFDTLFGLDAAARTTLPQLAAGAEHNRDASLWILHLQEGAVWHDGRPLAAEDVVYTINTWSQTSSYANQYVAGLIDFKRVRGRGCLVVEVPLLKPVAALPSILTEYNMAVVQEGATSRSFTRPIGTGPFKFESFTPGQQSVYLANRDYWQHPYPYVDKIIVNSSFTDDTARLDALLSGAIDVMPIVPPIAAKEYRHGGEVQVLDAPSPVPMVFTMRIDEGPFADVRVRQALRLSADRQALVQDAFVGFGQVDNDLQGSNCPYFASDLKREYDPEKARFLLRAAGREGMSFVLPTADVEPDYVQAATLLAEQAIAGGFNIKVLDGPAANYFGNDYATRPIGQDQGLLASSLAMNYLTFFSPGGPYNTTHWGAQPGGARASALLTEAIGAVEPVRAEQLWREVQLEQFNTGGQLAWGSNDTLDMLGPAVRGIAPGLSNILKLQTAWLARA